LWAEKPTTSGKINVHNKAVTAVRILANTLAIPISNSAEGLQPDPNLQSPTEANLRRQEHSGDVGHMDHISLLRQLIHADNCAHARLAQRILQAEEHSMDTSPSRRALAASHIVALTKRHINHEANIPIIHKVDGHINADPNIEALITAAYLRKTLAYTEQRIQHYKDNTTGTHHDIDSSPAQTRHCALPPTPQPAQPRPPYDSTTTTPSAILSRAI